MAKSKFKQVMKVVVAVFLISFFLFSDAYAQERAGEVLKMLEKKDDVPKEKKEAPVIEIEKKEPRKAAAPTGKKVLVKKFKIEGITLLDAETIQAITAPHEGKELTLDEIINIAEIITAKYRDKGYIIANAFVPAQEVKDGVVTIKVVEGRVGEITVTGNKYYSSSFIEKHIDMVRKDPSLKEERLERALLILNEHTNLDVKTLLKAGKAPATTDIVATVSDKFPISGSIFFDNFGSDLTSKYRVGATFNIGNILTSGDLVMLRGITGLDRIDLERLSYGRVEYLLPVGSNGTKLGGYYANSVYEAGEHLAILNIHGKAHVAGAYITHPIIKTRDTTLSARLGFEYKDIYEYMLNSLRSEDNLRVFNVGMTYDVIDKFSGRNFIAFNYYAGISNFLGGTGKNEPNVSRVGADGNFNKYTLDAMRIQKLPGYNHLIIRGSGQLSGSRLFVAEQFMLGGAGTVRGFKPSVLNGDSGYLLSGEFVLSPFFPEKTIFKQKVGDTIKFALFIDHGGVYRKDPLPGENKDDYLTSIGAGIRLYGGKVFSFRVDYAIPQVNGAYKARNSETYFQTTISF